MSTERERFADHSERYENPVPMAGVSTDREQLIKEAAEAMSRYEREMDRKRGDESQRIYRHRGAFIAEFCPTMTGLAEAAFAVFEKAHSNTETDVTPAVTPDSVHTLSDDEREALRDELAHWTIGSGYYQTSIGVDEATEIADAVLAAGFRRTVQGEPTDAQADAAGKFFYESQCGPGYETSYYRDVWKKLGEGALRAASGVSVEDDDDRIVRAVAALSWVPDHDGDDPKRVQDDYMRRAQSADEALAILTNQDRKGVF